MDPVLTIAKFIPFVKVDSVRREVSGIVTAEQPDKDREVCDYEKSKPYYQAWSAEFSKATDGKSLGNLRAMHQLDAVGKATDLRFNDPDKEIIMTFKVVDDDAWRKVEERVYTGFSQGGRKVGEQVPDPVHKGCVRYVANPSEVSLVDNPCLPSAHFAYVKSDGSVEMRKFLKTETPEADQRIVALEQEVNLLKAATAAPITTAPVERTSIQVPTKRIGDKDLSASDFGYVGDPQKTETWKFPIHTKAGARHTLAVSRNANGVPASEKAKFRTKVVSIAKKLGVNANEEKDKVAGILLAMRKSARVYVNKNAVKISNEHVLQLDMEIGKLGKGLFEVSRLAQSLEELSWLVYAVCAEQEWELDEESQLPEMLAENVTALTETLLEMVDEETRELLEHVDAHVNKK